MRFKKVIWLIQQRKSNNFHASQNMKQTQMVMQSKWHHWFWLLTSSWIQSQISIPFWWCFLFQISCWVQDSKSNQPKHQGILGIFEAFSWIRVSLSKQNTSLKMLQKRRNWPKRGSLISLLSLQKKINHLWIPQHTLKIHRIRLSKMHFEWT